MEAKLVKTNAIIHGIFVIFVIDSADGSSSAFSTMLDTRIGKAKGIIILITKKTSDVICTTVEFCWNKAMFKIVSTMRVLTGIAAGMINHRV